MTAAVRIPSSRVTPVGAYYFLNGIHPTIKLKAYDKSVTIDMMGGGSLPDRFTAPECVIINAPLKGVIGGWKQIDQQSATEDGVTFLDAVNEPMELDIPVKAFARDGQHLRKVVNTIFGCLDTVQTSEISWWTQELGYWWGNFRWLKPPIEGFSVGGQRKSFPTTLKLREDTGSWRTFDNVDEFSFSYESMMDSFDTDFTEDKNLGLKWPLFYKGPGGGYVYAGKGSARWRDDPARTFFTEGRDFVAGPFEDFETETDNQVVEIVFEHPQELGAANDIWGRQGRTSDGRWNGYGVRARIMGAKITVSAFVNFHETVLKSDLAPLWIPPLFNEPWRLECGGLDRDGNWNPRIFRVKRGGGSTVMTVKDANNVSPLGAAFRGAGFGGHAAGALYTQGTPAPIRKVSAGDSSKTTQTGHLARRNVGDQPMWDRYTLYGPGTFEIAAGPGSTQMVKYGPLLPNQRVQLRADGRLRTVVDLTSVPSTANELAEYKDVLAELDSYAPIKNIGPTRQANASAFGVVPPQGNMNRLIEGRFVEPIPRKSPGKGAEMHHIAVSITGGNADSKILAAGTPRMRYPQ